MTATAGDGAVAAGAARTGEPRAPRGFVAEWEAWQRERIAAAGAPYGPASLTLTGWLGDEPRAVPGLPGLWRSKGGAIVGSGFAAGAYTVPGVGPVSDEVTLAADGPAEIYAGERSIRRFARGEQLALRVFDPAAEGRRGLRAIAAYEPDESWRLAARFEADRVEREIELADGYTQLAETSGAVVWVREGVEFRLTATLRPTGISIVFGDETNGGESYGFRFLSAELPDADGRTVLDFNRAYLPPCAFSDQFVCPLPTRENRLPLPIRAGERSVVREQAVSAVSGS